MSDVARPESRRRPLVRLLIDGEFPWGAVISGPSRYGASQERLVVYPPGISRVDRRWLRAWRGFPIWGGVLWFSLHVQLLQVTSPWTALGMSVAVCAVAGMTAFVQAAHTRRHVRSLNACAFTAVGDQDLLANVRTLRALAGVLCTADTLHRRGEISAVQYELCWWQAYDALAERQPGVSRNLM